MEYFRSIDESQARIVRFRREARRRARLAER